MKKFFAVALLAVFALLGLSAPVFADKIIIDNNEPMEVWGTYPLCRWPDPVTEGVVELNTDTPKLSKGLQCPFSLSIIVDLVPRNLEKQKITLYDSIGREHVGYEIPPTFFKEYPEVTITAIPKRIESDFRYNRETGAKELVRLNIILDDKEMSFITEMKSPSKNTLVVTELLTKIEVVADVNSKAYSGFGYGDSTRIEFFEKATNALLNKRPLRMKGRLVYSDYVDFSELHDRLYVFFTVTKIE